MKKNILNKLLLFLPLFILIFISLSNMYFVSQFKGYENYFFKQTIWFAIGFLSLIFFYILKPQFFFNKAKYIYYINILLLVLVLFWGTTVNGSRAWFKLAYFSFQPSELMKFSLTLYLCQIINNFKTKSMKQEFYVILRLLLITSIPSFLVFLEPDTGAILIYFIILLGIIVAYKINFKYYIILGLIIFVGLGIMGYLYFFKQNLFVDLFGTSFFYRVDRILTFLSNDSFQLDRALISIGTALFWGRSEGVYIPEAATDFIVAFSISKLGIISFIIILLCFLVLDSYFLIKIFKTKLKKHKLFIAGFFTMFVFAQIQNIGMNLGLLPIIGLPLPFVSYGGTNIIVYFMFLGILINIKNK